MLKALHGASIDALIESANTYVAESGREYYRDDSMTNIRWRAENKTLLCDVVCERFHCVLLGVSDGKLRVKCNCNSEVDWLCKHCMLVLMTIKGLLSKTPVYGHTLDEDIQIRFLSTLLSIGAPAKRIKKSKPMRRKNAPALILSIFKPSVLEVEFFSYESEPEDLIPSAYLPMLNDASGAAEPLLIEYLSTQSDVLPLYWKSGHDYTQMAWDANGVEEQAKTVFHAMATQVQISIGSSGSSGVREGLECVGKGLAFDWKNGVLFRLHPDRNLRLYRDLCDEDPTYEPSDHGLKMTHSLFNELSVRCTTGVADVLPDYLCFMEQNERVTDIATRGASLVIQCKKGKPNTVLKLHSDEVSIDGLLEHFLYWLSVLPGPLKTAKNKDLGYALISGLFHLVSEDDLAAYVANSPILDEFEPYFREECEASLRTIFQAIQFASTAILSIQNKQFFLVKAGLKSLWMAGLSMSRLLDVPLESLFETGFAEVPSTHFSAMLPYLVTELNGFGVSLSYKNKLMESVPLDIEITTLQDAHNLDWFEIHPSIIKAGKRLSSVEWQGILNGVVQWENDGRIQVMSPESMEIVKLIQSQFQKTQEAKSALPIRLPRLQIFDWLALRKRGVTLNLDEKNHAILDRLEDLKKIEPTLVPSRLNGVLRSYQVEGYSWLSFLYSHRFGGCLADEMGLGKTLQAIALLAGIHSGEIPSPFSFSGYCPHLIVVPPTLMFNWEEELHRFYPDFTVNKYVGPGRSLETESDIVLMSYDTLRNDVKLIKKSAFHVIIFDEAQIIKNIQSKRASAARQLDGKFKLTLTGTPLENHLGEYFSVIDLAIPGLLGTYAEFQDMAKSDDLSPILKKTQMFVLRRKKEAVLDTLPPKQESNISLDLSPEQEMFYSRIVSEVRADIKQAYAEKTASQAGIVALSAILRLRQICVCPSAIDPEFEKMSPKIGFLCNRLSELLEDNSSALVFSQFRNGLDKVEAELKKSGHPYFRIDGSTPMAKRKELIAEFQNSDAPQIFLISLKTGGVGLNLYKANYVFHLDPWWNPAVENQASDRAHRIGQSKTVFVYRLLMRHSIEEKMMVLKEKKAALFDTIMHGASHKLAKMTEDDFDFLLS
ncbi:MAG: DEAD/DEAH box helicase [bacterium]|nr:DEAD/DEAH box helicase [bacterium]